MGSNHLVVTYEKIMIAYKKVEKLRCHEKLNRYKTFRINEICNKPDNAIQGKM